MIYNVIYSIVFCLGLHSVVPISVCLFKKQLDWYAEVHSVKQIRTCSILFLPLQANPLMHDASEQLAVNSADVLLVAELLGHDMKWSG
ncbi:hypothetical protein EDD68_104145 [Melghiribacillus thermohalophilus]|uniref:Uncharacterized protein n=1 Tax=Melghiribacillus thermohalophilus TaxID=1324956 RepID=A0A4R3ND08_9BACI|nr:hypothetical protein EDD68_104145 [Melghiribacillus thermohalophilus]